MDDDLAAVLAIADRDDAAASRRMATRGSASVARLLDWLRIQDAAQRQRRNDLPAAVALLDAMRAVQVHTPLARPGVHLVDQVAVSHIRPVVAVAALSPDLHESAGALLMRMRGGSGRSAVELAKPDFVEAAAIAVAADCPSRRGGLTRSRAETADRIVAAAGHYADRARRRAQVDYPQLTTWRVDTARDRMQAHLALHSATTRAPQAATR